MITPKTIAYAPMSQMIASAPASGRQTIEHAEHDRRDSAENQPEFVGDVLAQLDRGDDLENAR